MDDSAVVSAGLDALKDGAGRLLPDFGRAVTLVQCGLDRPGRNIGVRRIPARVGLRSARLSRLASKSRSRSMTAPYAE